MKLRALDQVHISSVQSDSLRPGQEFEVSDDLGNKMLKSLPGLLAQVEPESAAAEPAAEPAAAPAEKSEPHHPNKAEPAAPANKAKPKAKPKSK
jgi:hypothetical protein